MGALGIVHPPGVSGPFQDCPRLYFSESFLSEPPMWCEVALPPEDDAHAWLAEMPEWDTPRHHAAIYHRYQLIRHGHDPDGCWFLWPRGTLITHEFPLHRKVIWRLSGLYFPLTTTTMYEGKWPD